MDLFQSPFYILKASTFDNIAKLKELADIHSLLFGSDESKQAYDILSHPQKRLFAEIAWLPDVPPELISEILELLKSSPSSLFNSSSYSDALDLHNLNPVARANVIAAGLSRLGSSESSNVTAWILELANIFEDINQEDLMDIIDVERAISGFPKVSGLAAIDSEIQKMRRYYQSVIKQALDNLLTEELVRAVTDIVKSATDEGKNNRLIDDMIDIYELEAQSFFEKEEGNINTLVEKISGMISGKHNDKEVNSAINQLTKVLKNWSNVAQPININSGARGSSHKETARIVKNVRNLNRDIMNNNYSLDFSKQLTTKMREIFSEMRKIRESLDEDMEALNKARDQRNEIIFEATLGVLFKDKISLTQEELEWKGRKWKLNSITRIRWGGTRSSYNGIPTGTTYNITWGNDKEYESISPGGSIYGELVAFLWKTIGIRLLIEYLEGLKSGKSYYFGSALISDYGIKMERRKFFANEIVFCNWEDMILFNGNGTFCVGSKNDKRVSASFSYLENDNTHILEAMLSMFWKQGGYRHKLSSLLTTQN